MARISPIVRNITMTLDPQKSHVLRIFVNKVLHFHYKLSSATIATTSQNEIVQNLCLTQTHHDVPGIVPVF